MLAVVATLLLLLVLGIASAAGKMQLSADHAAASGQHYSPHHNRMTYCVELLSNVHQHQQDSLRDLLQRVQTAKRQQMSLVGLIQWKAPGVKPRDVGEANAFSTSRTKEQLEGELQTVRMEEQNATGQLDSEVMQLKKSGKLAMDTTLADITSCVMGRLNPRLYHRPQVSFMLQYYKRPWMIKQIVDSIRGCQQYMQVELVVNVDEPSDHAVWAELAANSSGLVVPVFNANVHEIRAYNRLAELASGRYLITHQDDEVMPSNCSWIRDVVQLMDAHPGVGALGMKGYVFNFKDLNINAGEHFRDRKLGTTFQFVCRVDFSPMLIRKTALRHVGGLDEGMSDAGECGIWSDWELSSRMWAAGWQVGFHWLQDREPDRSGKHSGTHTPENGVRCWGRQQGLASQVYHQRWGDKFKNEVAYLVKRLNHQHLEPIFTRCPFSPLIGGCDLWADSYAPARIPSNAPSPPLAQRM